MYRTLETGGERVSFEVDIGWVATLVERSAGITLRPGQNGSTMRIVVERDRRPFPFARWEVAGRGVRHALDEVLIENVARSGFDLLVRPRRSPPEFIYRRRPRAEGRLLRVSPALLRLRTRAALMHYPVLWRAATVSRAPLHAACVQTVCGNALIVGMPGAGKSTLLSAELRAGRKAISDNLCVADPRTVWGLVEPLRIDRGAPAPAARVRSQRTTYGRREIVPADRLVDAEPELVVVLRRGDRNEVADAVAGQTARLMVTSTYVAGELRRFWPFAATLSMTTGLGPAIPPVTDVARALTQRLPCVEVTLARPGTTVSEVLATTRYGGGAPASVGVAG